jgi:hypothetical protein
VNRDGRSDEGIRREEVSDVIATDERNEEGGKSEIMTALSPARSRFHRATSLRDPFL